MRFSLIRGNGNFLESKLQIVSQNIKCRQLLNEKDDWRRNKFPRRQEPAEFLKFEYLVSLSCSILQTRQLRVLRLFDVYPATRFQFKT